MYTRSRSKAIQKFGLVIDPIRRVNCYHYSVSLQSLVYNGGLQSRLSTDSCKSSTLDYPSGEAVFGAMQMEQWRK